MVLVSFFRNSTNQEKRRMWKLSEETSYILNSKNHIKNSAAVNKNIHLKDFYI